MKAFFSSYIFILIPFLALLMTKFIIGKPEDILLSTDWSVASFMIFAQSMSKLVSDNIGNKKISGAGLSIIIGFSVMLLVICLGVYIYVTINQTILGGVLQIFLFVVSSIWMVGVYKASLFINRASKN